jgi:hypothetical protein
VSEKKYISVRKIRRDWERRGRRGRRREGRDLRVIARNYDTYKNGLRFISTPRLAVVRGAGGKERKRREGRRRRGRGGGRGEKDLCAIPTFIKDRLPFISTPRLSGGEK